MKTEKEKMLAGELYNALDPQLSEDPADVFAAGNPCRVIRTLTRE